MSAGLPPLLIVGAGGHAHALAGLCLRLGRTVLGLTDSDPARVGQTVLGLPVLGDDRVVDTHPPATVELVNGIGSTGRPVARRALFERFTAAGYRFATLVDPSAILAPGVEIGAGAQILAGAVLQPGVRLDVDCIVNTRAVLDHDCRLGRHVHVAPGAVLSGGVVVEDMVHIGTGAAIRQGVRIGAGAVIGVGAAVVGPIGPGTVAVGVPARPRPAARDR